MQSIISRNFILRAFHMRCAVFQRSNARIIRNIITFGRYTRLNHLLLHESNVQSVIIIVEESEVNEMSIQNYVYVLGPFLYYNIYIYRNFRKENNEFQKVICQTCLVIL